MASSANIAAGSLTTQAAASKNATGAAGPSVDSLVWPSRQITLGPITTPLSTRGIMDIAVMGAAIMFGLLGFYLLVRPDLSRILNQTVSTATKVGETAAIA